MWLCKALLGICITLNLYSMSAYADSVLPDSTVADHEPVLVASSGGVEIIRGTTSSRNENNAVSSSSSSPARRVSPSRQSASSEPSDASGKDVVMYGASWCNYCRAARAYFARHQIPYTEYDVEKSARGREDYASLGGGGIPIIVVGDSAMRGFSGSQFASLYGSAK